MKKPAWPLAWVTGLGTVTAEMSIPHYKKVGIMFRIFRRKEQHEEDIAFDRAMRRARREYAARRPPPTKPSQRARLPWFGWPILAVMVAGALLAAFRTFPVFQSIAALTVGEIPATIEGFLAMMTIDLAVVMFRFIIVYQKYRKEPQSAKLTRQVGFGALVAVLTQFFAQLYATRDISSEMQTWSELEIVVAFSAALGAMALAFIAAEIIAVLWVQSIEEHDQVKAVYTKEYAKWSKGFGQSWARAKRREASTASADSGRTSIVGRQPSRDLSDAMQAVLTHLDKNRDDVNLSVRDLGKTVGVGKTTASKARNMWLEKAQQNGHEN